MKELAQKKLFIEKLLNSFFNLQKITQDPNFFYQQVEAVKKSKPLHQIFLKIIEASKESHNSVIQLAASNAITILNFAGIRFDHCDLSHVRIPGADLSYGHFKGVNFKGADLRGVKFLETDIRDVTWEDAKIEGATFEKSIYLNQKSPIQAVAYSIGGVYLAIGDEKGFVKIYEAKTQKHIVTLEVWSFLKTGFNNNPVRCLCFTNGSEYLATGSQDGEIRLWSIPRGKLVHSFTGHLGSVESVNFAKKGNLLISSGVDGFVRAWEVDSKCLVGEIDVGAGSINCLQVSRCGTYWISGGALGVIRLGSIDPFEFKKDVQGYQNAVTAMSLSVDGKYLLSGSTDGIIVLFLAETLEYVRTIKAYNQAVKVVRVSPDGKWILSMSEEGTFCAWSLHTGNRVNRLKLGRVSNFVFSPSGREIIMSGRNEKATVLSFHPNMYIPYFLTYLSHMKDHVVAFSPTRDLMVSGSQNGIVLLWSPEFGQCIGGLEGHTDRIRSISFSPDGKHIVSSSDDRTVRLWSVKRKKEVAQLGLSQKATQVSFSPDGRMIAFTWVPCCIDVWSSCLKERKYTLVHEELIRFYNENTGYDEEYTSSRPVVCFAFTANSRRIISHDSNERVHVWSMETGSKLKQVDYREEGKLESISFSPQRDYFAVSRSVFWFPSLLQIWNVDSCQKVYEMKLTLQYEVNALVFSSRRQYIAYACERYEGFAVEIWQITSSLSLSFVQRIPFQKEKILNICFSSNDHYLMVGGRNSIHVFKKVGGMGAEEKYVSSWSFDPAFELSGKEKHQEKMEDLLFPVQKLQKIEETPKSTLFFDRGSRPPTEAVHFLLGMPPMNNSQNYVFLLNHLEKLQAFLLIESVIEGKCYTMRAELVCLKDPDSSEILARSHLAKLQNLSLLNDLQGFYAYQCWAMSSKECKLLLKSIQKEKDKTTFYEEGGSIFSEESDKEYQNGFNWCIGKLSLIDKVVDQRQWKDFLYKESPETEKRNCLIM